MMIQHILMVITLFQLENIYFGLKLHLENNDVDKWLEYARLNYYKYMREQYGKDAFLD